ncbi:MAG: hypothetical protein RLZZ453_796 [Chlamydiota bacterium]|jgi:hypothetical protein
MGRLYCDKKFKVNDALLDVRGFSSFVKGLLFVLENAFEDTLLGVVQCNSSESKSCFLYSLL